VFSNGSYTDQISEGRFELQAASNRAAPRNPFLDTYIEAGDLNSLGKNVTLGSTKTAETTNYSSLGQRQTPVLPQTQDYITQASHVPLFLKQNKLVGPPPPGLGKKTSDSEISVASNSEAGDSMVFAPGDRINPRHAPMGDTEFIYSSGKSWLARNRPLSPQLLEKFQPLMDLIAKHMDVSLSCHSSIRTPPIDTTSPKKTKFLLCSKHSSKSTKDTKRWTGSSSV
jgi:hypothetical protein